MTDPTTGSVIYDDHIVTIELFDGQLILRDPKDIHHYHALASFFGGHASWKDAARDLTSGIAEHYRQPDNARCTG